MTSPLKMHSGAFEGLTPPYGTIVADPPWAPAWQMGKKAGPARRYSTMPLDAICALPVGDLAEADAHLWVWALNSMMEEAHQVVRAWGFQPMTIVTWCKAQPGVGQYVRNNTEHAILATRGRPRPPERPPAATWWLWPRKAHSVKPAAFSDLVEQVSPGPYVELFCRQPRFGWDTWGHGFEDFAEAAV